MHAPVLVTPPVTLPVTLAEAKRHLRVDGSDEDALIDGLIRAVVSYLDGWTGILGCCLVEQTWRQNFDHFGCWMHLRLDPIIEIVSITYRNADGQIATVSDSHYARVTDSTGSYVFWDAAYSPPSDLYEQGAVSVTFKAGYPEVDGKSTVPDAIKLAILLMVGHWYANREAVAEGVFNEVPMSAKSLINTFRRLS